MVNGAIAAPSRPARRPPAQEVAFGALNIPSAADLERLTRRVRSVSQRLEGIEDGVDRLDERLAGLQDALEAIAELTAQRTPSPKGVEKRAPADEAPGSSKPGAHRDPPAQGRVSTGAIAASAGGRGARRRRRDRRRLDRDQGCRADARARRRGEHGRALQVEGHRVQADALRLGRSAEASTPEWSPRSAAAAPGPADPRSRAQRPARPVAAETELAATSSPARSAGVERPGAADADRAPQAERLQLGDDDGRARPADAGALDGQRRAVERDHPSSPTGRGGG